jgi:hypothetical protein
MNRGDLITCKHDRNRCGRLVGEQRRNRVGTIYERIECLLWPTTDCKLFDWRSHPEGSRHYAWVPQDQLTLALILKVTIPTLVGIAAIQSIGFWIHSVIGALS